jgi:Domain of unknown function DUF11
MSIKHARNSGFYLLIKMAALITLLPLWLGGASPASAASGTPFSFSGSFNEPPSTSGCGGYDGLASGNSWESLGHLDAGDTVTWSVTLGITPETVTTTADLWIYIETDDPSDGPYISEAQVIATVIYSGTNPDPDPNTVEGTFTAPYAGTFGTCVNGVYDTPVTITEQISGTINPAANSAPVSVIANVTGSRTYGARSSSFSDTTNAPSGVNISGSVICTRVTTGQTINATLPAGSYTIDHTSCSGLTAPAGYTLTYNDGAFTVNQAPQTISFTAPATGDAGQSATLTATGGGSGNPVTFEVDPSSGNGVCSVTGDAVSYLASGTCVIDANQAGDDNYLAATQVSQTITVNGAPKFTQDTPPLLAIAGTAYRYQFIATGSPAPTYRLHGAPSWLHINSQTGLVTGTPPKKVKPFGYSVTASNSLGTATAGPFAVAAIAQADMAITLSCPRTVQVGHSATCTVTLTNKGPGNAVGAQTAITLPSDLSEASCSAKCAVNGNFVDWGPVSIPNGGTRTYSVTLDATAPGGESPVLAVVQAANPDPKTINNDYVEVINVTPNTR